MDLDKVEKEINKIKRIKYSHAKLARIYSLIENLLEEGYAYGITEVAIAFEKIIDIKVAEDAVLCLKDPDASIRFAKFIAKANIKAHEQLIFDADDPSLSCHFATVPGADVFAHSKIILKHNSPFYSLLFAKDYPRIDKDKHEKVILDSKNPFYSYKYCKHVRGANIKKHEKIYAELKNDIFSYLFAKDIKGANIKMHEQIVLEHGDVEQCMLFAQEIPEANIDEHIKVIILADDKKYDEYIIELIKLKRARILQKEEQKQ